MILTFAIDAGDGSLYTDSSSNDIVKKYRLGEGGDH